MDSEEQRNFPSRCKRGDMTKKKQKVAASLDLKTEKQGLKTKNVGGL